VAGLSAAGLAMEESTGFHRSDSLEIGIILSGQVEFELEGARAITLSKGSCWIQTGASHAWHNRTRENCVFALFMLGAERREPAAAPKSVAVSVNGSKDLVAGAGLRELVVTGYDAFGKAIFLKKNSPLHHRYNDFESATWIWETLGVPSITENLGAFPSSTAFPAPGGTKFGICSFAAHSIEMTSEYPDSGIFDRDHRRGDSIEYAIILSGEIELELDGCKRKLSAGSCLIQTGGVYGWHNAGTEPCVLALFVIGAHRTVSAGHTDAVHGVV